MPRLHKVYDIIDRETGEPIYVGRTHEDLHKHLRKHIHTANSRKRTNTKTRKLLDFLAGKLILRFAIGSLVESYKTKEIPDLEAKCIDRHPWTGKNMVDEGLNVQRRSPSPTKEQCRKIGDGNRRRTKGKKK